MNNSAIGSVVLEFMDSILTPEEIAASNLRVALIGELIKAKKADLKERSVDNE